jgi:hypothetical protein
VEKMFCASNKCFMNKTFFLLRASDVSLVITPAAAGGKAAACALDDVRGAA